MNKEYLQMSEEERIYGGNLSEEVVTILTATDEQRREIMKKSLQAHLNLNFGEKENGK